MLQYLWLIATVTAYVFDECDYSDSSDRPDCSEEYAKHNPTVNLIFMGHNQQRKNKQRTTYSDCQEMTATTEIAIRDFIKDKLFTDTLSWQGKCVTVKNLWLALRSFDGKVFKLKTSGSYFMRETYWTDYAKWWRQHKTQQS